VSQLTIRPLHAAIGAEIQGLEPRMPLDDETIRQLRGAFDEHAVLVFRDLDIDEAFQRYLVYALIDEKIDGAGFTPPATKVSNKEKNGAAPYGRLLFHCDSMWSDTPQRIISLYGLVVEPPGAPTQFISMKHGWRTAPEKLRERVKALQARHGYDEVYPNRGGDADVIDAKMQGSRFVTRPVAFEHPRTHEPLLYISQQATIDIVGLGEEENEALLQEIFDHLYRPEVVLEHDWRQGDLVVWDNIAAQHGRGIVTLQGPVRTLRKVFGPLDFTPDHTHARTFSKVAEQNVM
jgi:alpha-ketoglutarate-dependent taurine dioxygenase